VVNLETAVRAATNTRAVTLADTLADLAPRPAVPDLPPLLPIVVPATSSGGGSPAMSSSSRSGPRCAEARSISSSGTRCLARLSTPRSCHATRCGPRSGPLGSTSGSDPGTTSGIPPSPTKPRPGTRTPTCRRRLATRRARSPTATSTPRRCSFPALREGRGADVRADGVANRVANRPRSAYENEKSPGMRGFSIAGAGFEPATSGL
jgi:hypothetical protein